MCRSAENIFSPVAELQHGLAGGLFLLVNCRVSVSIPSSSLQVTRKYQIPFQISNPVYKVKQKQWEHFEHLGELLFYKVLIRFFTMQIRDCNKLWYINVVTNDGEKFRVLHKKPFGMLSILETVSTTANADPEVGRVSFREGSLVGCCAFCHLLS